MMWLLMCLKTEKLNPILTELFIRRKNPNIFLVFITKLYFATPKNIRLNSTHYLIMKVLNKRKLHQIVLNNSSNIDFQDCKPTFFFS